MMILLFTMSVVIIGMFAAAVASLQYADATSNDNTITCRYHVSDNSKCSQKDTPFILPFP